jgi:hypothetical protein
MAAYISTSAARVNSERLRVLAEKLQILRPGSFGVQIESLVMKPGDDVNSPQVT